MLVKSLSLIISCLMVSMIVQYMFQHQEMRKCHTGHVTTETTLSSKVMFLCASIARPRYNANGECLFDGKIGMWPFIQRVEAVRTSKQRPTRETMVTKPVSVSNKAKHRESMLQHIIPSIKEKWPHRGDRNIVMQQDGASAHTTN